MVTTITRDRLSQKAFGALFGLTSRHVYNLVQDGLPREVEGNRVYIPVPAGPRWYVEWKANKLAPTVSDEKKSLTALKLEVEIRIAQLELAKAEGKAVDLDYLEQQIEAIAQRVRARLLAVPGKYAPAMVGLRNIAEAQARLEAIIAEIMAALSETGEDPELDDEPEMEG